MKKLIKTISLGVLVTLFSGCEGKNFNLPTFNLPSMSIPSLDLSNKRLDPNLPKVSKVNIRTSLSEVVLEWQPIKDKQISGYRILRINEQGKFVVIKTIPDPYVSHYTDENINQDKFNTYMVSTYTNDGRVSMGSRVKIARLSKNIAPVKEVSLISNLPNRIKIIWRFSDDYRVSSYLIRRADKNQNNWADLAIVNKRLSVEYMDHSVKPGIRYDYVVHAKTDNGILSSPSKLVSGASKPLPKPVIGVMATSNLPKKIEVIWKKTTLANFLHYKVYASDFEDGIYSYISKTRDTKFIDTFDLDGATRFYRITVVDSDGMESSKFIKATKGRTLGNLKAPIITAARIINNTIELKWTQTDSRTVSYTIYKKYWDGWQAKKDKIINFTGTTFIDPKIKPDTTYTYYVVGMDKNKIPSAKSRSVNLSVQGNVQQSSWF